jgi:FG-GAP-like repeat/FG-GAP repeat
MRTEPVSLTTAAAEFPAARAFQYATHRRWRAVLLAVVWLAASARGQASPVITGPDATSAPQVKRFDAGAETASFLAYAPGMNAGVRVAAGDVDGDGTADIITATGQGFAPHVKVFSGTGAAEIRSFFAYNSGFVGGVYVAAGDVNGDGKADIITGAGAGGGPHVKVFNGATGAELLSFFAYPGYTGGVRVAAGDVNGDGRSDIITGPGTGTAGHVKVFDGATGAQVQSFFAYPGFTGGIFVAAGDLNGDGRADIVTGVDHGAASHVKAFSGTSGELLHSFFAYGPAFTGGVRVAVGDVNGDSTNDIITGAGLNGSPHVKAFHGQTTAELQSFFAYAPTFTGGVFVAGTVAPPGPPRLEVDVFPKAIGKISLMLPNGSVENIAVSGRTTIVAQVPPTGSAADTDGDGLDQVGMEIVDLELLGNSSLGAVRVGLNPEKNSIGDIEESANVAVRHLDVPPFAATGTAATVFNLFAGIQLGAVKLHTAVALPLGNVVKRKPVGDDETLQMPVPWPPVDLLDQNNNPTGIRITQQTLTPDPASRTDAFPSSLGRLNLLLPNGQPGTVTVGGASAIETWIRPDGAAADADANGFDEVPTELVELNLTGSSSAGVVRWGLRPGARSTGRTEESSNDAPGTLNLPPIAPTGSANTFFDVFIEIELDSQSLVTAEPLRLQGKISKLPAAPGEAMTFAAAAGPVDLLDINGNPTGVRIQSATCVPDVEKRVYEFPDWRACFLVMLPDGSQNNVDLSGIVRMRAAIPPDGMAADTDGDGRDQASAELIGMQLTGNSPLGPITLSLSPSSSSIGEFEELTNNTRGTLDLPPFTPAGAADSFFDVRFEVLIGGVRLHNDTPLHCAGKITSVALQAGELLRSSTAVNLLNADGNPTGIQISRTVHVPVTPVPVSELLRGNTVRVCRPGTAAGHVFQTSSDLFEWQDSTLPEVIIGSGICVDIPMTASRRFIRLRKPAP